MEDVGIRAIPIVTLLSVAIGLMLFLLVDWCLRPDPSPASGAGED